MKKIIIATIAAFGCFGSIQVYPESNPFLDGMESSRRARINREEYRRQTNACKSYIIGVAQAEKEASGSVSNLIQEGIDLIESNKIRYSDLCGIMDAHKQVLSLQVAIRNNRLLETKRESFWIEEAQKTHGGSIEVRLEDGSRVDLLTDTHAIDVEKASNWKEAIGQSLHYARLTDKRAGIILISEAGDKDYIKSTKYARSLDNVIEAFNLPIDLLWAASK